MIEDNEIIARQLGEACPGFVDAPDTAEAEIYTNFSEGLRRLASARYDLLILDLRQDDKELLLDEALPGLVLFEEIKSLRFVPVIFYSALSRHVLPEERAFVRVVEKTEGLTRLGEEVRRTLNTQLPALTRHIEDAQRQYMWDFVNAHWEEFSEPHERADLAYLLARRLALYLEAEAGKLAGRLAGGAVPAAGPRNVHPMEIYVRPPLGEAPLAGDVLREKSGDPRRYWVVLTPSCDFEQKGRLHHVLLAECLPLTDQPEYAAWLKKPASAEGDLKSLIGDNRQKAQAERFKYLPGTFFLPDLIIDFQRLRTLTPDQLSELEVIASLDSPFAEAVVFRFARYFGRLGTPDLDKGIVIDRLRISREKRPDASESREPLKRD
ncbi:MAG TPA: hypothetical protein VN345_15765 [Blastocatellia bacterium]|nr:hypothetical protein [Blastocatellia bacterium]